MDEGIVIVSWIALVLGVIAMIISGYSLSNFKNLQPDQVDLTDVYNRIDSISTNNQVNAQELSSLRNKQTSDNNNLKTLIDNISYNQVSNYDDNNDEVNDLEDAVRDCLYDELVDRNVATFTVTNTDGQNITVVSANSLQDIFNDAEECIEDIY